MRAAVLTAYGPPEVLEIEQLDRPSPRPGQVLVQVHRTTVTTGDTELRSSQLPALFWLPLRLWMGLMRPKAGTVLGMEVAGVVCEVGPDCSTLQVGDRVVAATELGSGTYCEYVALAENSVCVVVPEALTYEQVVALPVGGLAALGYLRKGGVARGSRVLVRGASGSIGGFAVQIARHLGAHVTGICDPDALQRVRELGAHEVLDYTVIDFADKGETYDLILDVVGKVPLSACLGRLAPAGCYVRATVPGLGEVLYAGLVALTRRKRIVMGDGGGTQDDLRLLCEWVTTGALRVVVDRRYDLEDVREAHRYVDGGHKQGNVVLVVAD